MAHLPKTRDFITSLIASLVSSPSLQGEEEEEGKSKHTDRSNDVQQSNSHGTLDKTSRNPLKTLTTAHRAILMTLYALFPNELLPALDLLDRELVTRFTLVITNPSYSCSSSSPRLRAGDDDATAAAVKKQETNHYYVRSAQKQHFHYSRRHAASSLSSSGVTDTTTAAAAAAAGTQGVDTDSSNNGGDSSTHYQVRTLAWSCSCPAFAFSAFPSPSSPSQAHPHPLPLQNTTPNKMKKKQRKKRKEQSTTTNTPKVGGMSLGDRVPICKHLLACTLVEGAPSLFQRFVKMREVGVDEMVGWAAGWGG